MKLKAELKQRELQAWTAAIRDEKPEDVTAVGSLPLPEFYGVTVRAAIRAGWFDGVDSKDAASVEGDLTYRECKKHADAIWKLYNSLTADDPNS